MRTLCCTALLIVSSAVISLGQAATTAKPPVRTPVAPATATASQTSAVIHTSVGDLHCSLFPQAAPVGVANFIGLANGTKDWTNPVSHAKKHGVPLYDGTIFHRVIPQFMIQGGDPAGTGSGDIGFQFKNETSPDLKFDRPGRLAYANAGPGTNGSQFFITEVPYASLNGGYTIFGQCDAAAVTLVKQIARMASDPRDNRPLHPVKIIHISIGSSGTTTAHHNSPARPAGVTAKPSAGTQKVSKPQ